MYVLRIRCRNFFVAVLSDLFLFFRLLKQKEKEKKTTQLNLKSRQKRDRILTRHIVFLLFIKNNHKNFIKRCEKFYIIKKKF